MSIEAYPEIQPVFDPHQPGRSIDAIRALLPQRAHTLAGMQVGDTASKRLGQGIEIDGIRPYQPGDESRHIDWRSTGRQTDGTLMVRQHYNEITPTLWIVTDMFQARHEANAGHFSERDLAASAVMSLLSLADRQGMPSAVVAVHERGIWQQKPGRGRQHIRQAGGGIARLMLEKLTQPIAERPLAAGLKSVAKTAADNIVIVASDFRGSDPTDQNTGWKRPLQQLAHHGNDITAVEFTNPWDFTLPEESDRFTFGATGAFVGGKKRRQFRGTYANLAAEQQKAIDDAIAASGAVHLRLSTDQGRWLSSLRDQLAKQKRKHR